MTATDDERIDLWEIIGQQIEPASSIASAEEYEEIDRAVDAVLAAGFRRQGPVTDAQVESAAKALAERFGEEPYLPWGQWGELSRDEFRADARAALEAARDAS